MVIVAQSTPTGRSAIAVVRMSGKGCIDIAKKMFKPFPCSPNVVKVGKLETEQICDQSMCVYFSAPSSYTGEDMVEFYCHGGITVPALVVEKCISLGCRMAQNGEFSKIAFINGKQNLSSAEGVIELIDAESILQAKASNNLLNNQLGKQTAGLQAKLTDLLAETEAVLDYPEEDLEKELSDKMKKVLSEIERELSTLLDTVKAGKIAKYGIDVAIIGRTNVGKSSLLNALVGNQRAIVTNIAGTTRDTVCESINYKDIRINFTDTAGIREAKGKIEKLGIERSKKALEDADLVLVVTDGDEIDLPAKPYIIIRNKCDLIKKGKGENKNDKEKEKANGEVVFVSAKTGENIEAVKQAVYEKMQIDNINSDNVILTNLRHIEVLNRAKESVLSATAAIDNTTADCVAAEVKNAWDILGEITGATATQDIIDRVFEKFCLGK